MGENPKLNKDIADIFGRYLKKRFSLTYVSIGPQKKIIPSGYPDIDEILRSDSGEFLFLQNKRPITQDEGSASQKAMKMNEGLGIFRIIFEPTIERFESKYLHNNRDITNTILLLHSDNFYYFTKDDELIIDKKKFAQSAFRGIYIVSQKYTWLKEAKRGEQGEFVLEIKDAFKKNA